MRFSFRRADTRFDLRETTLLRASGRREFCRSCWYSGRASFRTRWDPFRLADALLHTQLEEIREDNRAVCAAGWFKTQEREEYARFTKPVYQDQPLVVVGRSDNGRLRASTFEDLILQPKLKMLARIDFSFGSDVDGMIEDSGLTVRLSAAGAKENLERIVRGYADFLLISPEELSVTLDQVFDSRELAQTSFPDIPFGNTRHIICSMSVSEDQIRLLDEAIAES